MDLLFKEYASPYILLDDVISSGQLNEFLNVFQEQREEKQIWEFYLHKLAFDDRTFDEFKNDIINGSKEPEPITPEQVETTVKDSYAIMQSFDPNQKGE